MTLHSLSQASATAQPLGDELVAKIWRSEERRDMGGFQKQ